MLKIFLTPEVLTRLVSAMLIVGGAVGEVHMQIFLRGFLLLLAAVLLLNAFFRVRKRYEIIRLSRPAFCLSAFPFRGAGRLSPVAELRTRRNDPPPAGDASEWRGGGAVAR